MSHSVSSQENQQEQLNSPATEAHSPASGSAATLPPPPFNVSAADSGASPPADGGNTQFSSKSTESLSAEGNAAPGARTGPQTLPPPPFHLTASSLTPQVGPEEEEVHISEQKAEQRFQMADGGPPSAPNGNSNPPAGSTPPATPGATDKSASNSGKGAPSAGEPLPEQVRLKMEQAMQADFSKVRIHKNSMEAVELGALAFARGNDIHFAPGQYRPHTPKGQELLGHELAHVLQQASGRVAPAIQAKGLSSTPPATTPVNNDPALEREADQMGGQAANSNELDTDSQGDDSDGIIPALTLFGERLDLNLSQVENTTTLTLDVEILPGVKVKRINVVIEEGVFVSATLYLESAHLSGIDLEVTVDATGAVSADIALEHEFFGFPTSANAQLSAEGIVGYIAVTVPEGHPIMGGLKATGGNLNLEFGGEANQLTGNLGVSLNDGFATGFAQVEVDLTTLDWSGKAMMQSQQSIDINVVPGVDIQLPEGFSFDAEFGSAKGLTVQGGAMVKPQVTLRSTDGMEAGGTADLEVRLDENGLDFVLHQVKMVVTGGLNAPDLDEALEAQHLTSDMDAGAILTLSFEENNLTRIDLEVTGGISNADRRIGRLSFAGQATFNPFQFIGMLHAVTNAKFTLTQGEHFTTYIMAGSQLFVSLDNSGVSNVDASLGLELADQESALANLTVASSLPRGGGLSLAAKLQLLRRLALSSVEEHGYGVAVLPSAGLTARMVEGALEEIQGALPVEVADAEGDLLAGSLEGKVAFTNGGQDASLQNGMASATLLRDLTLEMGSGEVRVLEGASVEVRFEDGKVVGLGGEVAAVYNNGSHEVNISAAVDYDPTQKILRSLDASMATEEVFSLFDGKLQVSEIEGGISIRNNEVVSLGGHARLDAYIGDFTLAGEADVTWTNVGDEPSFTGAGWLEFSWFEEDNEDRFLNGRVEVAVDGDNFDLLGTVRMGLMKGLTGEASVAMDQEMDPVISAALTYSTVLMEANELWAMEFGMGIQIPIVPVLVTLEAGILFGMSINTRPLMVFGTVGVENWRPKSSEFPDFHAQLRATWGLDIEAKVMAYLELILGIDNVLHLTGGVRAGVGLNIPIELAPYISLHGGQEGIWGEMGVDLSINPILKLLIDAYMEWGVLGIWEGEKVWSLVDQELADLGNINWSGSFAFGDKEEPSGETQAVEPQEVAPAGSPIATPEGLNEDSSLGFGNHEQEPDSEAGLSGLTNGLEAPSPESAEGEVDQEGLGSQFQKVGEYADGIAAVGDLVSIIADGFKALIKGGPVGLILWMIFEKPSKEEIQEKKDRVAEFRAALTGEALIEPGSTIDIMLGILGGEYSFWIIFDKSKPFRDMVDRGMHRDATLEDRAKILEGMIKGWTGEKDESRIIEVLEYTLATEGAAGVRELTEYVGGQGRIRDQYEWTDFNDRDDLDRIFGRAYGNSSIPASERPTYTAKEGAKVKRTGRSWEELAVEAYGHESWAIYLLNFPFNRGQISQEEAYQDHQNNQNNTNTGGGPPNPFDDDAGHFDPGNQGGNSGPPRPDYLAYIPKMSEIVELHENSLWRERFPVPGVLTYAHWFENYEMIAQFAYGDARLADQIKAHNLNVPEVKEGSEVILPSPEDLGPPWIEVAPVAAGSSGMTVWVAPDSNELPVMWMGQPERLVAELAQEAMAFEEGKSAAEQLLAAATFDAETGQVEAENAVQVAANLIDFIVASGFGAEGAGLHGELEEARPGDTVRLTPDQVRLAAELVYHHPERAAWIVAFNAQQSSSPTSVAKSSEGKSGGSHQLMEAQLPSGDGARPMKLPTWAEMAALDPLPATERGIAPKSRIEVASGDSWSSLAVKAYGNWELAVALAEYAANTGKTMEPGTIVTLPSPLELVTLTATAQEVDREVSLGGDGPMGGGPIGSQTASQSDDSSDGETRSFIPGSNLVVKAGDTWSAIAVAAYDNFALFVKLSNHPKNVPFKTLPEGVEIYLPTLAELEGVPEFGLGLSPTGNPLLTEMVRVPTSEELHHVWVENRAPEGEEVEGVWMMASTPFELEPESEDWIQKTKHDPEIGPEAEEINRVASQGKDSMGEIEELPDRLRKIVDNHYFEEGTPTGTYGNGSHGGPVGGVDPEVKVKLYGLEETYELYMAYMFHLKQATPGMYIAAFLGDTPMEKIERELDASLKAHGFSDVWEFKRFIERFLDGFEKQAARTFDDTLARYKDSLCDEQSRYQSHDQLVALQEALKCNETEGFAILNDENLPDDKKVNRNQWKNADISTLESLVEAYILTRIEDVQEARNRVAGDSELVFKIEEMRPYFYRSQGIEPGSIYDKIVLHKIEEDAMANLILGIIGAIAAIALTVVSLGTATPAIVAAGAAAGAFGLSSYFAYQEYQKYVVESDLADVGLMDDPSVVWLVIAVVGAALDMGAAVKAVRALAPAAKVLDAGGDVTEFGKAVKAMQEMGEIDAKIAQAANRAAQARASFQTASDDLVGLISRLGANPFLDPQVYFAMVRMGVAKITEGIAEFHQFVLQLKAAKKAAGLVEELSPEELAKAKEAWLQALKYLNSADEPVQILSNAANPKVIGRFSHGKFLEVISRSTRLYGGNTIRLAEGKTTTILGNMDNVGAVRIRGEQFPGVTMQGANPGGINSLFSPRWVEIVNSAKNLAIKSKHGKSAYWRAVTDEFWTEVNGPWVREAIARGDQFRLVADPNDAKNLLRIMEDGDEIPTIFSREIKMLEDAGYTILGDGTAVKL